MYHYSSVLIIVDLNPKKPFWHQKYFTNIILKYTGWIYANTGTCITDNTYLFNLFIAYRYGIFR